MTKEQANEWLFGAKRWQTIEQTPMKRDNETRISSTIVRRRKQEKPTQAKQQ